MFRSIPYSSQIKFDPPEGRDSLSFGERFVEFATTHLNVYGRSEVAVVRKIGNFSFYRGEQPIEPGLFLTAVKIFLAATLIIPVISLILIPLLHWCFGLQKVKAASDTLISSLYRYPEGPNEGLADFLFPDKVSLSDSELISLLFQSIVQGDPKVPLKIIHKATREALIRIHQQSEDENPLILALQDGNKEVSLALMEKLPSEIVENIIKKALEFTKQSAEMSESINQVLRKAYGKLLAIGLVQAGSSANPASLKNFVKNDLYEPKVMWIVAQYL